MKRREFLKTVSVTATGALIGGYRASAAGLPANETIHIGLIGTGGRCGQLMERLTNMPGVKVIAVCDTWDVNLERGKTFAEPNAQATRNYQDLLANKDVDAVLVVTPDHLHVPITIDACEAGKDVYVEKPLTHDIAEGQSVTDAKNKTGRIVQVGMQQRSMPHLAEAREIIKSGQLGTIRKVHLTWNRNSGPTKKVIPSIPENTVDWKAFLGNAKDQPFDPYKMRNWRFFWDFGGGVFTDLMVHFIDVAHWFLDLDHPDVATSIGNWFNRKDQWETPDTVQTLMQYNDPEVQVYYEGTFYNARNAAMMEYMGSEATLYCDRGRYEIHPEYDRKIEYKEKVVGTGARGQDFYDQPDGELLHLGNWLECIRSRKAPNAPVEAGVSAANAAHLANKALRENAVARWS
ncbi:MAG: Gfo/Idh/MocA family oxidoreductase [Candidatus Hydrogenedentes bacterium]|nr:Gfo/Idh/MocA family oxidoreductase [Candidatus Hydrogenedentota bacterium]